MKLANPTGRVAKLCGRVLGWVPSVVPLDNGECDESETKSTSVSVSSVSIITIRRAISPRPHPQHPMLLLPEYRQVQLEMVVLALEGRSNP